MMKTRVMACLALLALLLAPFGALAEALELSGYYGQDIAAAAEEIGGLTYQEGEEFRDNYEREGLALRGEGTVRFIDMESGAGDVMLCGVTPGMARKDALALMEGYSKLWEYDEEVAFMIVEDADQRTSSQLLVLFFDEDARVSGAWYRSSEDQ